MHPRFRGHRYFVMTQQPTLGQALKLPSVLTTQSSLMGPPHLLSTFPICQLKYLELNLVGHTGMTNCALVKLFPVALCFFLHLVSAMTDLQLLYNWFWSYSPIPDSFPFYASVFSLTGRTRPPVATDQHRIHLITGFSLGQENWSRDFPKHNIRYQLLHPPTIRIQMT